MPVRNYVGEFRIDPAGDAGSTVVWSAEFELTAEGDQETVESIRQFLHAGIDSLRRRYGGAPPRD
jgi:Polyketide cyclase / dehydrase and lipid transport